MFGLRWQIRDYWNKNTWNMGSRLREDEWQGWLMVHRFFVATSYSELVRARQGLERPRGVLIVHDYV